MGEPKLPLLDYNSRTTGVNMVLPLARLASAKVSWPLSSEVSPSFDQGMLWSMCVIFVSPIQFCIEISSFSTNPNSIFWIAHENHIILCRFFESHNIWNNSNVFLRYTKSTKTCHYLVKISCFWASERPAREITSC